jgi:hypothetical protein
MLTSMRITLPLWAAVALAVPLIGQIKPKDTDGWGKVRWGMTIAEVRTAYNINAPTQATERWTSLPLGPIKVGDVEMDTSAECQARF